MSVPTNLPADGGVGLAPPPDAPIEISQPLQADAGTIIGHDGSVTRPIDQARRNERELEPLMYGKPPATDADDGEIATLEARLADLRRGVKAPIAVQAPKPVQAAVPDLQIQPAASNTDSPSRGTPGTAPVPATRATAPLQASGGFGASDAEYFPLDGAELKALVEELQDKLHARIQDDLRFSVALTYPRVSVKLQLIVEGEVEDTTVQIDHLVAKHDTPIEVAQRHGDSVVFVLVERRREFTDTGDVEQPADAIRDEIGLAIPHKRHVQTGAGKRFADVNW